MEAIRVLLVEDNPGDARLIQIALQEITDSPITLTRVERLTDGLLELKRNNYDALLLDLALPDSESSKTLAKVREHYPDIPTILLTGAEDDDFGLEAVRQGAQDFLSKEKLDGRMLTNSLQYAVERKRLEDMRHKKEKKRVLNYEILDVVKDLVTGQEVAATSRGIILEQVDEIHQTIYGNHEPSKGMLWRLELLERFKAHAMKIVWGAGLTGVGIGIKLWMAGEL